MASRTSLRVSRLTEIQQMVADDDAVTIGQLVARLGVSEATVRRDLDALQQSGVVQRTHGGAVATQVRELPYPVRGSRQVLEKRAIARAAVTFVSPGDTVFIGGGSTTLHLADQLVDADITVVTNSLPVATELSKGRHGQVIVIGGTLRTPEQSMIGPRAVDAIRSYRAGVAFLGVPALDSVHGFTADGDVEAATDLAFIESAQRCVVLADHTKLGRVATTHVVPLTAIDTVVTDTGAPPIVIDELQAGGTRVVVAERMP
ncbi:MAG: DeoR/GlpR family DNA-binding transcription regulator [Actinomycetia bacterium]|nr:DeoR/GlpR family DNA-binding transcription regulator [Actinomycetes bacterium]